MRKMIWEMDDNGSHRIVGVCDDGVMIGGYSVPYASIASLIFDDRVFIAVSAYFEGVMPHEKVIEISVYPNQESRLFEGRFKDHNKPINKKIKED